MKKLKVYVGCSLTHATTQYKEFIIALKNELHKILNVEILEFIGLEGSNSVGVYKHDIHTCVKECDIFIAECSNPSTGLGYELGVSVELWKKPTLAVCNVDAKITRLVEGIACEINPNFEYRTYVNLIELVDICTKKIILLQSK